MIATEVRANLLGEIASILPGAVSAELTAGAERVAARARELVPVRTGTLRASIGVRTASAGAGVQVEATAPYAAYVEFGTIHMAAEPYLQPAVDEVTPALGVSLESRLVGRRS